MAAPLTAYGRNLFATAAAAGNVAGVLNDLHLGYSADGIGETTGNGYARIATSGAWGATPALVSRFSPPVCCSDGR